MTPLIHSLFDELEKIAISSGAVKTVSTAAKKAVHGLKSNIVGAVKDLRHPLKSIKKEFKTIKHDISGKSSKSLLHKSWYLAGHGANAALTAAQIPSAIKERDPSGAGRSRLHRLSTLTGSTMGGLATGSRGLSGGIIGAGAGATAGHLAGKAIDKIRGYKPKAE